MTLFLAFDLLELTFEEHDLYVKVSNKKEIEARRCLRA